MTDKNSQEIDMKLFIKKLIGKLGYKWCPNCGGEMTPYGYNFMERCDVCSK